MLTLYITRHGETIWNTQKRMQGWSDSDLTENGIKNAVDLRNRIKEIDFIAIYSSPSKRTQSTANLIKGNREISIILDDNLKEINMGEWGGNTISFIEDKYPKEYYSFWNTPHLYKSQKGEDFYDLKNRVLKFLDKVKKSINFRKYTCCNSCSCNKSIISIY